MSFHNKPFDSIEESDLQDLIDSQVSEGKTTDYKEALPGRSDPDKKEFLADVSSFANASGGHIVYGMKEEAGIPNELCGLPGIDPDAEKLRLDSLMRDCIDPRIPGVSIRAIPLKSSAVAIVIRIPRSWALPHMVTFQGNSRFYSRGSGGKYQLDVSELRALFGLSESAAERIRRFRTERLNNIVAGETPIALEENAKIVFHVIPFSTSDPTRIFDVASLADHTALMQPIYATGWNHRHNFDGFMTYSQYPQTAGAHTYLQVFRNGSIEAVETTILSGRELSIPSLTFEQELLKALPEFLNIQKHLGVEPPLFVFVTLTGVKGYRMGVDTSRMWRHEVQPIDKDTLLVPEIVIESFEYGDVGKVMRPIFDAVWNASGWPQSIYYDEQGNWRAR